MLAVLAWAIAPGSNRFHQLYEHWSYYLMFNVQAWCQHVSFLSWKDTIWFVARIAFNYLKAAAIIYIYIRIRYHLFNWHYNLMVKKSTWPTLSTFAPGIQIHTSEHVPPMHGCGTQKGHRVNLPRGKGWQDGSLPNLPKLPLEPGLCRFFNWLIPAWAESGSQ